MILNLFGRVVVFFFFFSRQEHPTRLYSGPLLLISPFFLSGRRRGGDGVSRFATARTLSKPPFVTRCTRRWYIFRGLTPHLGSTRGFDPLRELVIPPAAPSSLVPSHVGAHVIGYLTPQTTSASAGKALAAAAAAIFPSSATCAPSPTLNSSPLRRPQLLEAGVDIEARSDRAFTPLLLAAKGGHLGAVRELRAAGAAVEARNDRSFTALLLACQNNHREVLL